VPFPSQFLHFCFFCPVFFRTQSSKVDRRSSPTFFKRSLAILPSFNDPERDPLMFLQIGATATPTPAPSRRATGFVVFEAWSAPLALTQ
jgi:hypothetical protein